MSAKIVEVDLHQAYEKDSGDFYWKDNFYTFQYVEWLHKRLLSALNAETAQQANNTGMAADAAQIAAHLEQLANSLDKRELESDAELLRDYARQLRHA